MTILQENFGGATSAAVESSAEAAKTSSTLTTDKVCKEQQASAPLSVLIKAPKLSGNLFDESNDRFLLEYQVHSAAFSQY